MGWVWSRRLIAPARQNPANRRNRIRCIVPWRAGPRVEPRSGQNTGRLRGRTCGAGALTAQILPDCKSTIGKPKACSHYVEDRERHQNSPSEVHQLVIAEARQSSTHPNVKKQEAEDLEHEPENWHQCVDKDILGGSIRLPKGLVHPPKNSRVATQPTLIIFAYSAMKNIANFIELYSVW